VKEQAEMKAVVTFSVGHYRFCISAHEVKAFITAPTIKKLPVDAGEVEGVFDYRGKIVTAVSLRRKLGLTDRFDVSDIWIISCVASVPVAFQVDSVMNVIPVNAFQWRQIEALPSDYINRFALHEKEIFLFISFETLLAMPNMPGKSIDRVKREFPVKIKTAIPDSAMIVGAADDCNIVEVETSQNDPMKSAIDVTVPEGGRAIDHPTIQVQRNDKASHHSLTSVSRKNRFAADTHPAFRERQRKGNHIQTVDSKTGFQRSGVDNLPEKPISQDDAHRDITGLYQGFGRKSALGIAVILALLLGFILFHFRGTEINLSRASFSMTKKKPGTVNPLAVPDETAVMSLQERLNDEIPEKSALPTSKNSPKTDRTVPSVPKKDAAPEPGPAIAKNRTQDETISLSKAATANDACYNIAPNQSNKPVEVLRIEAKKYTFTVVRSSSGPTEPGTERAGSVIPLDYTTHIVVKGDTLWDVAERHLNDPFRYPELAEVSNILDPHWIYPGDIIRIIKNEAKQIR